MKRAWGTIFILALADCRPKPEPPPPPAVVEVPLPPRLDAGVPTATATFALHSILPPGPDLQLFELEDGIVVVGDDGSKYQFVMIAHGGAPVPVPSLALTPGATRIEQVVGTTADFLVGTGEGVVWRVTGKTTRRLPKKYHEIVEFRDGQWLGMAFEGREWTPYIAEPSHFDLLLGEGDVPVIPAQVHPRQLVHLGDGKMCGVAVAFGFDSNEVVWTATADGHQFIAQPRWEGRVFRGPAGGCQVLSQFAVFSARVHTISRVEGDDVEPPIAADDIPEEPLSFDREGGIWWIGKSWVPQRLTMTDRGAVTTRYPIPEKLEPMPDCAHPTALHILGLNEHDAWIAGVCRNENWTFVRGAAAFLLHLGPAGQVHTWPKR